MENEIRMLARKFAQTELAPHVEEDEAKEHYRPENIEKLGALGLMGVPFSESLGGAGLGYQEYTALIEELAAVHATYAISVSVTGLVQLILSKYGNDTQQKKYIPPMASGKAIGAFALSEPSSGSDAGSLRTAAKKEGGRYVINGNKFWITQGNFAETLIVFARTGAPGPKGISALLVPKGSKGLKMGKREKKMGFHSSHTMEVIFENVEVPLENLVGNEGEGFKIAMTALDHGRMTIASVALGLARSAFEVALNHSKIREQFGQPIGQFQGISFMLADMATEIEKCRLLTQKAAKLKDEGADFTLIASMAKMAATDMAMKVTTDAVQILGGSGYTQEFPVERFMREAKVLQILEGANQIQKIVIARLLTQGKS